MGYYESLQEVEGGDYGDMNVSGEELTPGLSDPLTQPSIGFILPNMSDNVWKSNFEFSAAGMQAVYYVSNLTLSAIFPKYDQYLGYAANFDDMMNISRSELETLVWENKEPLGFILGCLVFILLLTLWGVGWCFSKCCCGDKGCCASCLRSADPDDLVSAKLEQKRDKCKRNCCGVLFAVMIIAFMFGLVCCFVTNEQMRLSVERMPEDVDNSLADVDIYLNTTERQINALFKDNYMLLSETLNQILDRSGDIIKTGLSRKTGAETLNNLTDILDTVDEVRQNVLNVEKTSKSLKGQVSRLKNGLTDSKTRLLGLLDQCQTTKCSELKNLPEIRGLRVQNDFQNALAMYYPKLPNMTGVLSELSLLLNTDVRQSIEKGKKAFDDLGKLIDTEVEPVLPEIRITIDDTGKELAAVAKSLTNALSSAPVDSTREKLRDFEEYIKKYAPLRYYAVLGVCLTLAFIFTLLALGIFVGFCGRQPGSQRMNECCSRKTGSTFINCGIFFIFLTGGVLMAVAVLHFILAGTLTQVICQAVRTTDNRTEDILRLPKLHIGNSYNYHVPPYHEIITECQAGNSAYSAFQLKAVYSVENITTLADRFKRKARKLADEVNLPTDATDNIVFLSPEAKQQLERFSKSKISRIKFDTYANNLEDSIVSVDLRDVIARLSDAIENDTTTEVSDQLKSRLQNEILILESLQEKILTPMVADVKTAAESLRFLFRQQKDLTQRVDEVANAAEKAQEALHSSGARQQVRELARDFEGEFVRHVEDYANFTYQSIRDKVGQCDPLYNAFNASTTTFCYKIGAPLSAFWFSLTCLLILFVPLLLVGMMLARLYRKYKYLGYESETYYSTYGDGDTIPLSLSANGRRLKRGREPTQSQSSAAARFPARFEDTSQNETFAESLRSSNNGTPSVPSPAQPHRSTTRSAVNLRFIDTPHDRLRLTRGFSNTSYTGLVVETTPPPPYHSITFCQETAPAGMTNDEDQGDLFTETEAWGSQMVFNNHHTPPTSGEYERPPPYYYPGPAT